jgi:putative ABC transport system permease protein
VARFADEMALDFVARLRRHRARDRGAALRFVVRASADALWTGMAERWSRRGAEPRRGRMGSLGMDLKYGVRTLLKSPGFSAVAVLTLGLGIGANSAIFSVVNTVLLQPLPFREPDRLVGIAESRLDRGWEDVSFTHANFWDVRDQSLAFDGIAALRGSSINLSGFAFPERLRLGLVSAEFFRVLGVDPVLGRTFAMGEDEPGRDAAITVLSHAFWARRFGADRGVIGRSIILNDRSYAVIGVVPPGEPWLNTADVYLPLTRQPDADRSSFELAVIGRLKPGVGPEAAQADLSRVAMALAERYPVDNRGMGIRMTPARDWVASDSLRRSLWVLMGAVGFLLLIACVNLANLLLARATGQHRERALRAALGASRARIARQVFTESLLLSGAGALAGLGLAYGVTRLIRIFDPGGIPRLATLAIDPVVLVFTALTALVTGLVVGTLPALESGRADLAGSLREGDRGMAGGRFMGRLRGALVAAEVAASLALLIGAALLLRSFANVLDVDRGFETDRRVIAEVALPDSYDGDRTSAFVTQALERLRASPGVEAAAVVSLRPLVGVGPGMGFAAADQPAPPDNQVPWAAWRIITMGYFETIGVPLLRGRDFTEQDRMGSPWRVIISRRIAERLWPGQDPVGRTLTLWQGQSNLPGEVIGVAGDMRDWELTDLPSFTVYLPMYGAGAPPTNFVVHTTATPGDLAGRLREIVRDLDPALPVSRVQSLDERVSESVAARRFLMLLLVSFAGVALLLALAGVYGVLAYSVSKRTAEIGVRLALGATPGGVLRFIVGQGMRPVLLGVGAGVTTALLLGRLMTALLFGIKPTDATTYGAVAALLAGAAVLACYLPARRALRLDVVAALRRE